MRPWITYPLIGLGLALLWLLLTESVSTAAFLLATALALAGCATLLRLRFPKARLRRLGRVPGLLRDVVVEVFRSNNAVARIILRPSREHARRSGFVRVPLDMRSPHGLAALACILTATPGTVWVDYDSSDGTMLLHVLDLIDEDAWVRIVKERWERRLMEIFE